jgi:membrane-bound lytic murein transglycosylase D
MAIRARILVVAVCFWRFLMPGTPAPAAAEPLLSPTIGNEPATVRPVAATPSLDLGRPDPSVEPVIEEGGSANESPAPAAPVATVPHVEEGPWAHTIDEAALQAAAPPYPVDADHQQVQFFLDRYTGSRREVVGTWFGRSGRYLSMIRDVLRSKGLPEDLAFTAMVESGFNPLAVSRAGAKGLWQFMATTARRYGLRVDHWVDERLDPQKSTLAAAAYLQDLYRQFGSWALAQAAYNAGEVAVARAVRGTGSTDFWTLAGSKFLRQETKEFVPQIHAATVIGRDPVRFGFDIDEPTAHEVESISVPPSTDLRRLSAAAGISADLLHSLNAVLLRGVTPPGGAYELRIPAGAAEGVRAALAPRHTAVASARGTPAVRASGTAEVHVVRPRETVSSIARQYGVSIRDVLRWNRLDRQDRIRPGDRIRVVDRRPSVGRDGQGGFR